MAENAKELDLAPHPHPPLTCSVGLTMSFYTCHTERRNIYIYGREAAIVAVLADLEKSGRANFKVNKKP